MNNQNCVRCGEHVPTTSYNSYRQVTGWERVDKGTTAITNKEATGQVMHFACMVKSGLHPGQREMFG